MDQKNVFVANGFYFVHDFDSGNLGNVEAVPSHLITPSLNYKTNQPETPDYEFNLWTRPDCAGTEFENGNRTWFYFGIVGGQSGALVKLNILNLNKQGKMYSQGMAPVTRILPGKPQWERIKDKPLHWTDDNMFTLTFKYRTTENVKATQFFAFTYPFSFGELQIALNAIDMKFLPLPPPESLDEIYYHRECLVYSLERRRVDLLTITSYHSITNEREPRLKNLFPEKNESRPFRFHPDKKIIFVSARVHPGETPASFVFNGVLNVLLTKTDPVAMRLRQMYVFKLIPILNPDGVARGHYRTDTRGVNLNRVYLNPSLRLHPTIYAARAVIRYCHHGYETEDDIDSMDKLIPNKSSFSMRDESPPESRRKQWTVLKQSESKKDDKSSVKSNNKTTSRLSSPKCTKTGDTNSLIDQVIGINLQEARTQTPSPRLNVADKGSSTFNSEQAKNITLDSMTIRDCLGTELRLTSSDELSKLGSNPLKDLRETLKKSISLLIGSHSYSSSLFGLSALSSSDSSNSQSYEMRIGWCPKCTSLMAANDAGVAGVSQKIQTDSKDTKAYEIMFCSNCFKRYAVRNELEHEMKIVEGRVAPNASHVTSGSAGTNESREFSQSSEFANNEDNHEQKIVKTKKKLPMKPLNVFGKVLKEAESGLFLYIDFHGHASKKGIFMYGNHFEDLESNVECMLLPRIMSLNNLHFHFSSCNFTEKNMYLRDRRDGMSREGSGRVAVLKATGLVRSYTLECNYNTGRFAAPLTPPCVVNNPFYNPSIYQEVNALQVGKALAASILDLTNAHPNSKIPNSEHRNLTAIRDWLRHHAKTNDIHLTQSRLRPKVSSPATPLFSRTMARCTRPESEKKENTYFAAKTEQGSNTDILRKPKVLQCKTIARCFTEQPPQKVRSLLSRPLRRCSNKSSKATMRAKASRMQTNEAGPAARGVTKHASRRSLNLKAATSETLNNVWRDVYGGKRPRGEIQPNHNLKKIRLKSVM